MKFESDTGQKIPYYRPKPTMTPVEDFKPTEEEGSKTQESGNFLFWKEEFNWVAAERQRNTGKCVVRLLGRKETSVVAREDVTAEQNGWLGRSSPIFATRIK